MSYVLSTLSFLSIALILSLSCFVVLRAGEISFGQQAFFGVGAYVAAIATAMLDLSLAPALLLATATSAIVALLVGSVFVRTSGFRFTLMTLVFGEFVKEVLGRVHWTREVGGRTVGPEGALGFSGIDYYYLHGVGPAGQAALCTAVGAAAIAALVLLDRSSAARRLDAVAGDPDLAASLGIEPIATRLAAFVLAGGLAGLGGALFAHHASYIDASNFSLMFGVHAVAYTLLGGLGSVLGPLVGTIVDVVFLESLRVVGSYRMVAFGALLVLMLILRPQGLLVRRGVRDAEA